MVLPASSSQVYQNPSQRGDQALKGDFEAQRENFLNSDLIPLLTRQEIQSNSTTSTSVNNLKQPERQKKESMGLKSDVIAGSVSNRRPRSQLEEVRTEESGFSQALQLAMENAPIQNKAVRGKPGEFSTNRKLIKLAPKAKSPQPAIQNSHINEVDQKTSYPDRMKSQSDLLLKM